MRRFFAFARQRKLILTDPARPLRLGAQPGFTGTVLDLSVQQELFHRWTSSTTHPHERLTGLLALLHAASSMQIRALTTTSVDHRHRTLALPGRPFPTPADPPTWTAEKEQAAPTWKKTFGFHPLAAFADHGAAGNGEPLAIMLRTGGAGSNTAADHIETTRLALAQLPRGQRRRVLVRTDSAGGTHSFLEWLTAPSRRLHYSVGVTVAEDTQAAILKSPGRLLDAGLRRRRAGQGRGLGRRHHRDVGPVVLAGRDAGHRPQGAAVTRGATAVHRHRRAPVHRVRHRRQERAARGPRTAAPPPGPLRGPDRAPRGAVYQAGMKGPRRQAVAAVW